LRKGEYFQTLNICTSFQKATIPSTGCDHSTGRTSSDTLAPSFIAYHVYKMSYEEHDPPLYMAYGTVTNAHNIDFIYRMNEKKFKCMLLAKFSTVGPRPVLYPLFNHMEEMINTSDRGTLPGTIAKMVVENQICRGGCYENSEACHSRLLVPSREPKLQTLREQVQPRLVRSKFGHQGSFISSSSVSIHLELPGSCSDHD
jgi:hypothetical protein